MKQIVGTWFVSSSAGDFLNQINNAVSKFQENGQEVEVQYQSVTSGNQLITTALIIGRK